MNIVNNNKYCQCFIIQCLSKNSNIRHLSSVYCHFNPSFRVWNTKQMKKLHCVKIVRSPYFPAIELNTKIYVEKLTRNLHRKIYQKNSEHGHFLRSTGCTVSKFKFFNLIQFMFKNQCASGQQNTRKHWKKGKIDLKLVNSYQRCN